MKIKLMALGFILFFIITAMPIVGMTKAFATEGEQQPSLEQNVIDPNLEKILAGMSPSDNISVIVYLRRDPSLDQQIQAIWQGQPDDEMHTISENLMQQLRKVSAEMLPYEEQLQRGDPAAIERYKKLEEKYGINDTSTRAVVQRLNELHDAKSAQIEDLHEQAYSDMQQQAKQRIEQLPDTKITSSTFLLNNFGVATKAGNIQALAAIPDVVFISDNPAIEPAISPYLGLLLLSPNNGSIGNAVKQVWFSWKPFEETTKYEITLAKDPGLTQIIKQNQTINITYEYDGTLGYNTNYFWQVKGIEPPSDPSATFSFRTEVAPTPVPPEAAVQSTHWSPILTAGLVIALAAAIGIITWFLVARSRRGGVKTSE